MSGGGNATAGDDPNSCIPGPLKDFVFDLYQSTRHAYDADEQSVLYSGTFRDLTAKYFASSAWPSPASISSECGDDPLFLAFYSELTIRHLHSTTRPQVRDLIEGWHVYCTLFDLLLSEAPETSATGSASTTNGKVFITPEWAFDIVHEFVYQFQGFCQFRTKTALHAHNKSSAGGNNQSTEALVVLSSNRDAWAVETVLFYLHRFLSYIPLDKAAAKDNLAYKYLGIFSSVAVSRLECLLGDYHQSLVSLAPLYEDTANMSVVNEVFKARLSLAYHAGVSYFMLRRYKDTINILSDMCLTLQRGFKSGQLTKLGGYDQFKKLQERMIAILAIVTHICPYAKVDDALTRAIRDKHGSQLSKIELGENGYEDLFILGAPKFISPALPDYTIKTDDEPGSNTLTSHSSGLDAYNLQIKQFMTQMSQQRALRKLRSYLKLYTSIPIDKLAAFNDTPSEEFISSLLCYKHKMNQLERNDKERQHPILEGTLKSAMDIHYYINENVIHISESNSSDGAGGKIVHDKDGYQGLLRFEHFYMQQIVTNEEIRKDIDALDINF